jgi:hypothetical protein
MQESPKSAAFESKADGELQPEPKKYPDSFSNSWNDLLNDPKQWWDYRESKRSGLVVIDDFWCIFLLD